MKLSRATPEVGTIEAKDPFATAPPGHSLTLDNSRWPWGQPPRHVDPEVVLQEAVDALEQPRQQTELMKLLMVGVSVEALVEGYLIQGFQEGRFTPDVAVLIKGPLALTIAGMAEEEGIPYRFFENNDELASDEMDDRTFFSMMKENNPQMFAVIKEKMNEDIRRGAIPQAPEPENFMNMMDEKESE
ncbi:MAG: hypothetical protein CME98_10260 [Hyphomonas sp.]|nr:hypothetical protein [Hyphomonas sp.]|tara:strand:+ start:193 stop:753 length:561 start_codon:yes stop_codon:yes gene_type:complete